MNDDHTMSDQTPFPSFCEAVRALLDETAAKKGYNQTGLANTHVLSSAAKEQGSRWPRPTAEPDLPAEVEEALAQALARALVKSVREVAA